MLNDARPRRMIAGLLATLVIAVGLLVRVSVEKQDLEESGSALRELAVHPHAGMYVPIFRGTTTSGDTVALGDVAPGTRQLLFFFTTRCPYCRASIPSWKLLARTAGARPDLQVWGVALDSLDLVRAYEAEHELEYRVVQMEDRRFAGLFRVSGVPLTMIIDPTGQVAWARRGEFSGQGVLDSIRAVLDAPLSDTRAAPLTVPSVSDPAAREP